MQNLKHGNIECLTLSCKDFNYIIVALNTGSKSMEKIMHLNHRKNSHLNVKSGWPLRKWKN